MRGPLLETHTGCMSRHGRKHSQASQTLAYLIGHAMHLMKAGASSACFSELCCTQGLGTISYGHAPGDTPCQSQCHTFASHTSTRALHATRAY